MYFGEMPMNEMHESNRRHWDKSSEWWESLRDQDGLWRRLPKEPELGFAGGALEMIRDVALMNCRAKTYASLAAGITTPPLLFVEWERMLHR